jgi:hypothetical protein
MLLDRTAHGAFPEHCDAILVLSNATWWAGKQAEPRSVQLRMQRLQGNWDPVVVGHTIRGQNATHYGFITETASEGDVQRLKIRFTVRPDRWIGGEAENAYSLTLRASGSECSGSWTGIVQGLRAGGAVTGSIESVACTPGFVPPARGEHPCLLIRKTDIPTLKARAATPEGQAAMAALKADRSVVSMAFVYALTGDASCASNILAALDGPCNTQRGWWHHTGGDQHSPAFRAVEHLIAYDLAYDLCTESMRAGLASNVSDKLDLYYWGAQNSQFNPNDPSNWSLMYRSALGMMGLAILDSPVPGRNETAPASPAEFPRLSSPPALEVGEGVPVVQWKPEDTNSNAGSDNICPWLLAGPVTEAADADAFAESGGIAAARPKTGTRAGDAEFRSLPTNCLIKGSVDLKKALEGKSLRSCYLYCVLDVPEAGYFRLEVTGMKGVQRRKLYVNGHAMEPKDYIHLAPGRYPVLARLWIEPVGGWEPLMFWAKLVKRPEGEALAWHAARKSAALADAECGANWREELTKKTGRNLTAWAYARMAAYKAEKYFMKGLGEGGWDQEGGYTRHALHLAMPFAHCFRNTFGRDIRGAERMGTFLTLAAARTIFVGDGMISQAYSSGGGPMDLTLIARGFSFVPAGWRPGLLWTWNRSDALAREGKYKDVHAVSGSYDALSSAMRFVSVPPTAVEKNPAEVMPRVYVDRQKGGYVFRNRWQDGDDCVVQISANSNQAGGSWASAEAGVFRMDGLGVSWAVRGEGYGQGTSRERLDASMFIGIVDVGEHYLSSPGVAQAWTTHFDASNDGSGIVALDMSAVYRHQPRTATVDAKKRPNPVLGETLPTIRDDGETTDLGIKAVRSFAVDYSGAAGAPCLVAVGDRLTGTHGSNTWVFVTEKQHAVTCQGNTFVIAATNGATLRGTVVRPANAALRIAEHAHVQEINYRGSHNHRRFDTKLIQVAGQDRDQEFLVVMTIQKDQAPVVTVTGSGTSRTATVGKRSVGFDGVKIALDAER